MRAEASDGQTSVKHSRKPPVAGKGASRDVSTSMALHAHWGRRHILDAELQAAQLRDVVPTSRKAIKKPAHW